MMPGPSESVLSTLPSFPTCHSFNYNNIDSGSLLVIDSSSPLDPSVNLISSLSNRPEPSFEATLPVIKTEDELMTTNVPRTFDGIRFSSMLKRSLLAYPFSYLPTYSSIYSDFKPHDFSVLPALPWVQPT